ncbi:hypothetical protein [Paraburkholderia caribensis]|uniref:hypothetical protein n=1 Tax=Paraburkholderia TaxID=1822464 RepID=UPI001CABA251|nr:hypothetical protein [Paraburkholderia caribensis]BEU25786.1 hypothetical protein PBP221_59260 [Paraburkholderia sp. 22B1P]CAG9250863.1 conserved hypothetical protein [Paraburkholderia caribensis]
MTAPGTSLMMSTEGTVFKTDRQITQYLLCHGCEQKFSKNGEDYFADVAMPSAEQTTPPLLFRILRVTLIPSWNRMGAPRFSFGSGLYPEVNSHAVYYYAISLFWRAGLDGWHGYTKLEHKAGLMELMQKFLLGGDYVPGHVVRILPSFWRQKHGFVLPYRRKDMPFFSMYMYDFYLEECSRFPRFGSSLLNAPILYTADSFESVATHAEMIAAIKAGRRTKALQAVDKLISW